MNRKPVSFLFAILSAVALLFGSGCATVPDAADLPEVFTEDSNDGPVIVSLYDDNGALISESSKKDWDALSDKKTASVHIYYKGEPVLRVKTAELGIPFDEIDLFCRWLPKSLNKDADLQKTFIKKMASESPALLQKYPELQKGI